MPSLPVFFAMLQVRDFFQLHRCCRLWVQRRTDRAPPLSVWLVLRVLRSRSVSGQSSFPSWWPMSQTPAALNT